MKKGLFAITILLLFLISCSGVDPQVWNNNVISVYNKSLDDIEDFQELISLETIGDEAVNKQLQTKADRILMELDKAIKHISEAEIPNGGDELQTVTLEMLESMKTQMHIGISFVQLTEDTTEAEVDKYADEYDTASSATEKVANRFLEVQNKFAESAGLAIK